MIVKFVSVKYGNNNYWLNFEVYAPQLDINKKYYIKFCGTELIHTLALTDMAYEQLKDNMHNTFGMPPYDINKVRKKLKENIEFEI